MSVLYGYSEAKAKIAQIGRGMPRDVLSQARKLAFEWHAQHGKKDDRPAAEDSGVATFPETAPP